MEQFGKALIFVGVLLTIFGFLTVLLSKFPFPFGNLPGDIKIEKGNFTFYLPLASSLIISLILTGLLNLIVVLLNRR